jgi:hypothetical protein
MSDFKFFCPECGQKIACDEAYSGLSVTCPACQKLVAAPPVLTTVAHGNPPVPVTARPATSNPSPAAEKKPTSPPAPSRVTTPTADRELDTGVLRTLARGYPWLAVVSLVAVFWFAFKSIPIIVLVWAVLVFLPMFFLCIGETRYRRQAVLTLNCSSVGLGLLLLSVGTVALANHYFAPKIVVRESQAELDALKPRIVDEVLTGLGPSERDHQLGGKNLLAGPFNGKLWRSAVAGGSIIYVLKVLPGQPMSLNCRYWGGEQAGRTFDISIDDKVIATQNLEFNVPGHFFDTEYRIPRSLTHGKTQVTVKFQAHPGLAAGGLFGCQILKR